MKKLRLRQIKVFCPWPQNKEVGKMKFASRPNTWVCVSNHFTMSKSFIHSFIHSPFSHSNLYWGFNRLWFLKSLPVAPSLRISFLGSSLSLSLPLPLLNMVGKWKSCWEYQMRHKWWKCCLFSPSDWRGRLGLAHMCWFCDLEQRTSSLWSQRPHQLKQRS